VTETKPKNNRYPLTGSELRLANYNLFTTNLDNTTGRGIAVYTHTSLNATQFDIDIEATESLWIKIRLKEKEVWLHIP
jgi:hypothetical protein